MEQARDVLIEEITGALVTLLRTVSQRSAAHWIDLDVSLAQVKTLLAIGEMGSPSIEQIASMLGVSQPTTSHLVERLVQSQLAHRAQDPQNRRRALVHLTQEGDELLRQLLGRRSLNDLPTRLRGLSNEELAVCAQGIHLLIRVMTNDPALLSFTSSFPEQISKDLDRSHKETSPIPEDNV